MATVDGLVMQEWSLGHSLEVEYTLINSTQRPQLVFAPEPPYVLPQEDGRLVLTMTWMPVPDGALVEVVEQPPVIKLAPLAEIKRNTRVSLPVRQAPAYDTIDVKRPPVVRDSTRLEFLVGFLNDRTDIAYRPADFRGQLVQSPDVPFTDQRTMLSQPVALNVPMRFRVPVPFPFQPVAAAESPIIVLASARESLALNYTLRNNSQHGIYAAVPAAPSLTIENETQLHIRLGPTKAAARGAVATPAVHLAPGESQQRTVLLDQPVFSDRSPLVSFPTGWAGRDVRATGVRLTQVWWEDAITAMLPGSPTTPPKNVEVPPTVFALLQQEEFFDEGSRILLWKGAR